MNTMKLQEKARQRKMEEEKARARENAGKLESVVVKIAAKAGEGGRLFGSVTNKDISDALREQYNIDIEKSRIIIADPIKSYGSYEVKCKFGYEISGTIHLLITESK